MIGVWPQADIWPVVKVTIPATLYPVGLDEVKAFCDYEGDDRDADFDSWIATATEAVEHDTERALVTQTWAAYLPWFPEVIRLTRPPVTSISSIAYIDYLGVPQTLATSVYQSNLSSTPPVIRVAYAESWPDTREEVENAVTVTFVAGYGAPSAVPDLAKMAIKLKVRSIYEGCEDAPDGPMYMGLVNKLRWRLA